MTKEFINVKLIEGELTFLLGADEQPTSTSPKFRFKALFEVVGHDQKVKLRDFAKKQIDRILEKYVSSMVTPEAPVFHAGNMILDKESLGLSQIKILFKEEDDEREYVLGINPVKPIPFIQVMKPSDLRQPMRTLAAQIDFDSPGSEEGSTLFVDLDILFDEVGVNYQTTTDDIPRVSFVLEGTYYLLESSKGTGQNLPDSSLAA
jgi:hypothetical protein